MSAASIALETGGVTTNGQNVQVEPGSLAEESAALTQGRRDFDFKKVERAVRLLLEGIGEDLGRDGLRDTPARVARMYEEITTGLRTDPTEALQVVFEEGHDEMVLVRDIPMFSLCEHHLIPFIGKAHVAYIPNEDGRITGLSKLARVVDGLAKQPQVQERLTDAIADALMDRLKPQGALVVLEAEHLCMSMRGIRKPGAVTVTSAVRGMSLDSISTRLAAMSLLGGAPVSRPG
jgi:GTP cyclohydrolase IA